MKKRILLIEDDSELTDNITALLEGYNYIVLTAQEGKEGIRLAKQNIPDLIICDIMMPKVNGYDVIEAINNDPKTSLIPFIFLSAKVERTDIRKGMYLGADDYLLKPFSAKELLDSIESRLKKTEKIKNSIYNDRKSEEENNLKLNPGSSIFLPFANSTPLIKIDTIKYISAERQYTNVYLKDGRQAIVRKSLNEWEKILPDELFIRIHRATIINTSYIQKVIKSTTSNYRVLLENTPNEFEVSRRYAKRIKDQYTH